MNKLTPWFYGWNIVAMTFLSVLGHGLGLLHIRRPIKAAVRNPRCQSIRCVLSAHRTNRHERYLGPWLGRAVGERSIRGLMTTGILVMAAGLAGISLAETIWQFYIAFMLLVSVGFALAGPSPIPR